MEELQESSSDKKRQSSLITIILLLGIILIICALIGTAVYLSVHKKNSSPPPPQNSISLPPAIEQATSNWKIYSNPWYQFKYPSTWAISPATQSASIYNTQSQVTVNKQRFYNQFLFFNLIYSTSSAQMYVDDIEKRENNMAATVHLKDTFQKKSVNFGNGPAVIYQPYIGEAIGWYIAFSNGQFVFTFGPLGVNPESDATIKTILSTFSFKK